MPLPFNDLYRFDEFVFDPQNRSLVRNGMAIPLAAKSCQVLAYLVSNAGRIILKDELLNAVWPDSFVEESNLPVYISGLRKALGDRASYIATAPGLGYKFTAAVTVGTPPDLLPPPVTTSLQVQQLTETTHVVIRERLDSPFWTGRTTTVVLSVGAVLAAAGWWFRPQLPPKPPRQLVVADFVNSTHDPAFDGTLKPALEIVLAQSPYMNVLSERDGVKTLQHMGLQKDTLMTPDVAREVCERTNREVLLTGSISSLGQRYILTLDATDCASGKHLVGAREDSATKEGVLDALDHAGEKLRKGLHETEASLTQYQVPLRSETTSSLDALKAYSIGVYLNAQGKLKTESMHEFQRAIELDPQFAMAYGELGVGNLYLGQTDTAAAYFKKAFDLSAHVSANERLCIRAWYFALGQRNLIEGVKAYRLWGATYPEDPSPPIDEVDAYMTLGQWDAALAAGERARKQFAQYPVLHENLATIYRSVNRFDDAKTSALTGSQVGKDAPSLHINLFEIAFAQQDVGAIARENLWFDAHEDGSTVWYYPAFRGEAAASAGSMKHAEDLFRTAHDAADRSNLGEAADRILLSQALTESKLGLSEAARSTLAHLHEFGSTSPEGAIAKAELGDTAAGDRFLLAHATPTPDTLMTYFVLPRLRATLALNRGKPLDAIAALESARPYEMRDYSIPTLRGEAYMKSGQPALAIIEFTKILDHPGLDPTSILYPLAHLSLARAYNMRHNLLESRQECDALLNYWKGADPDLPALRKATVECSRLTAAPSSLPLMGSAKTELKRRLVSNEASTLAR